MSDDSGYEFFKLRKQVKTYISKVFSFGGMNPERIRNVIMVNEGGDEDPALARWRARCAFD